MEAVLRAIFKPLPKPGDVFVFDDWNKDDPWGKEAHKVEVIETRSGWVRYRFCNSKVLSDERLRRSSFHFCYKEAVPNAGGNQPPRTGD